jgi:threonine dehydrogenase-like Zn-dependent dehydrogenase
MVVDVSVRRIVLTRLLGRLWHGAHFAPFSPLRIVELPDPPLPASGWARVQNHLCGICGSDLHQLLVDAGLDVSPLALPSNQRIYLGHEMVGHVTEISGEAQGIEVGDRVVRWGRMDDCLARGRTALCDPCARGHRVLCQHSSEAREHTPVGGGFGDTFISPAASLVKVPDGVSDEQAILSEPVAVALHAAWRKPAKPGDKVLVLGCGTIGFLLIQMIRFLQPDCEITAVAQFAWQADLAHQYGASHTFLAHDDGYVRTTELTGAKLYQGRGNNRMLLGGYDLAFDVVGIAPTLNDALRWTRAGGTVVLVGVNLHRMLLDVTPVWYQEVDLIGAIGHDVIDWHGERISTFDLALRWMQSGKLDLDGILTHRFSLPDYRQAFAVALDKEQHRSVKVAFDLSS